MRRATIASRSFKSGTVVASSRQIVLNRLFPLPVTWRLLDEPPPGPPFNTDAVHFGPQGFPGALSTDGGGEAGALAGRATSNDIESEVASIQVSHIGVARNAGKILGQDTPTKRVDLTEGQRLHAGSVQPER